MDAEVAARMRAIWAEVSAAHPDWPEPNVAAEVLRRLEPAQRAEVADSAERVVAETAWFLRRGGKT